MDVPCDPRFQSLRPEFEQDDNIIALYLFGSQARGTASRLSDIGVLFQSRIDASRYFPLRLEYIARVMGLLRTERVDVVILNNASLHLAYEIMSHGTLLLDRDPRQRVAFEADRIRRFLDFKPFLAVQHRAIKKHLAKGTFFD
ncbi:MAG: nucleotidyltransferase domain-containing protein [Acidobacteriota bacterium]|jgi:predicted nucleotidyltransferase